MENSTPKAKLESILSRRSVLAGLAASAVVAGCKSTEPGSGSQPAVTKNAAAPTPIAAANPDTVKAALALWLLFTTRDKYFYLGAGGTPGSYVFSPDALKRADLLTDLKNLPGKTDTDRSSLIDALKARIVNPTGFQVTGAVQGTVTNGYATVTIPYAAAIVGAQQVFQMLGLGQLVSGVGGTGDANQSVYDPKDPYCPAQVSDILKIATNNPITQDPGV
jgi:hypothetical protein